MSEREGTAMSGASGPHQMRIFISHSSTDRAFANALAGALRGAGADVWLDDSHLGTGQLLGEIQRQLRARPVFVVVLSKAAFTSEWVPRECEWAYNLYTRDRTRILLPVVCGKLDPSDFDEMLFLETFRRIEAPGYQPFPQAEAISRALQLLQLTPAGQPAQHAAPPQPAESADDLITRGKALSAQGRHQEALPLFERATQLAPNNFSAWDNLAYTLNELKRWQEALAACERALAINANSATAWNNKGMALNELGRYQEGLAACDRALVLDPNSAIAWNNKGLALRNLGRTEEALACYDRALALDPNYAMAWNNKGDALYLLKRYEEALACFDRALAIDPRHALALGNRPVALRALGRGAEAREAEARVKALGG